ncbi:MAG: hypothetical protein IJA52_07095 [Clostridia bacterium]|nr:hypothetical protein [Clostridia bacterium]
MAINEVPTLILGIGGIGCRIAANINDLLRPEDREHIAIIGMDTNVLDLNKLANRGIRTIQTSDERTVGEYLSAHPEHISWFPVHQYTVSRGMLQGAGQIRAISRLGAIASEEAGKFLPIKEEIQRIRENRGELHRSNLTVMVVGSITGGTGAGLFLQMPYYIRKIMREEADLNIIIRGMFVGPDITTGVNPSKINQDAVRVNAYACLKELNAEYVKQTKPERVSKINVDFYEPDTANRELIAENLRRIIREAHLEDQFNTERALEDLNTIITGNPDIPYDYLYLIENSFKKGSLGLVELSTVEAIVARMVHVLMFTPVSFNALSVEDNMVLHDMATGGMNRYSSAGLCRLVYPVDIAKEYVALATIRDMVKDEWLLIDTDFDGEVRTARAHQKTDGTVDIPVIEKSYGPLFKKRVMGEGAVLGRLYKEAFTEIVDAETQIKTTTTKAATFISYLDEQIKDILGSDEVINAIDNCTVDKTKMKKFDDASRECNRVYNALDSYGALARRIVRTKPASIVNEIMPPDLMSMHAKKDSKYNIFNLLSKVHPLTARFLCYELINYCESQETRLLSEVSNTSFSEYLEADYDPKTEGIQTASAAVNNIEEKQIAILKPITSTERKLKNVYLTLVKNSNEQQDTITAYIENGLKLNVCEQLLKKLRILAENYSKFFDNVARMINENNKRIENLEGIATPIDQIGVYCSEEAFRCMAEKYKAKTDITDIPKKAKKALFDCLYGIMVEDLNSELIYETDRKKASREKRKNKSLAAVFEKSIVKTIISEVQNDSHGIVDMNILDALRCEYDLENVDDDITCEEYIRQKIASGLIKASPFVSTTQNSMADNTQNVYLALHPSCAGREMGEVSSEATAELYVPYTNEATDDKKVTTLIEDAFSAYELVCFRARYKFSIEDLTKYAKGSQNEKAYTTRISNLKKEPMHSNDPDRYLTIVNPHLNRFWHEYAFLPSIYKSEETIERSNIYKAFIYALGYDLCFRAKDDSHLNEKGEIFESWFFHSNAGIVPVKVCGNMIGGTYIALLNALFYNGEICHQILEYAKARRAYVKSYTDAVELEKTILNTDLIKDISQSSSEKDDNEENIFDIFREMRNSMPADEWKLLFVALKEVIWEYCAHLFDSNEHLVNEKTKEIVREALKNCKSLKKAEKDYGDEDIAKKADEFILSPGVIYRKFLS